MACNKRLFSQISPKWVLYLIYCKECIINSVWHATIFFSFLMNHVYGKHLCRTGEQSGWVHMWLGRWIFFHVDSIIIMHDKILDLVSGWWNNFSTKFEDFVIIKNHIFRSICWIVCGKPRPLKNIKVLNVLW